MCTAERGYMIIETHAHYDDDRYNEDRDALLRRLPEEGVGVVINSGASVESTRDTIRLARECTCLCSRRRTSKRDRGIR